VRTTIDRRDEPIDDDSAETAKSFDGKVEQSADHTAASKASEAEDDNTGENVGAPKVNRARRKAKPTTPATVISELNKIMAPNEKNKLTDLHAHLMGMGSSEFWLNTVMLQFLASQVDEIDFNITREVDSEAAARAIEKYKEAATAAKVGLDAAKAAAAVQAPTESAKDALKIAKENVTSINKDTKVAQDDFARECTLPTKVRLACAALAEKLPRQIQNIGRYDELFSPKVLKNLIVTAAGKVTVGPESSSAGGSEVPVSVQQGHATEASADATIDLPISDVPKSTQVGVMSEEFHLRAGEGDSVPPPDSFLESRISPRLRSLLQGSWNARPYECFVEALSIDVIFLEKNLMEACGLATADLHSAAGHADAAFQASVSMYLLQSRLQPEFDTPELASLQSFESAYKTYVVYDFREDHFTTVTGIPCRYISKLVQLEREARTDPRHPQGCIESMVRNWFSMLEADGDHASLNTVKGIYRGSFTPEFFPMRYSIKDCIYSQEPSVLALLLNHVMIRYRTSGVDYAELSISNKDVLNPHFLPVMNWWTFASPLLPDDKVEEPKAAKPDDAVCVALAPETALKPSPTNGDTQRRASSRPPWRQFVTCNTVCAKPWPTIRFLMAYPRNVKVNYPCLSENNIIAGSNLPSPFKALQGLAELAQQCEFVAAPGNTGLTFEALAQTLCSDSVLETMFTELLGTASKGGKGMSSICFSMQLYR
jgi:hypothetical protein